MARILGIETSCDETAAAVVEDRRRILSNVIASQVDIHRRFGGVVPEIASRHHIQAIGPVIQTAMEDADCDWNDLDAIAVTSGPGLIGCLLVGLCTAKSIAWQRGLPLLAINHLEGHIRSAFIENDKIEYPALALVVSGGHTQIWLCPEEGIYESRIRTRDDAAGEAFDKVAKLLGLGYPGGPVIDRLAEGADEKAIRFPIARMKDGSNDFSFSGLKSAVRRIVRERELFFHGDDPDDAPTAIRDLVASFQRAVIDQLSDRVQKVAAQENVRSVLLTGGVACNRRLRDVFGELAARSHWSLCVPSPGLTTDNAAMIAAAGFLHLDRGEVAPWSQTADACARLT
jgi:N6-L-threonylcarbamoyladenine synthase